MLPRGCPFPFVGVFQSLACSQEGALEGTPVRLEVSTRGSTQATMADTPIGRMAVIGCVTGYSPLDMPINLPAAKPHAHCPT